MVLVLCAKKLLTTHYHEFLPGTGRGVSSTTGAESDASDFAGRSDLPQPTRLPILYKRTVSARGE